MEINRNNLLIMFYIILQYVLEIQLKLAQCRNISGTAAKD